MIEFNTTILDEELNEALEDYENADIPELNEWVVNSAAEADKLICNINKLNKLKQRMDEIATQEINDIIEKRDARLAAYNLRISKYEDLLRVYFEGLPEEDVKETKTQRKHTLLNGSLILKKPKLAWEHDDAKLLDYLKTSGQKEYIKTEEKPKWGEFKKALGVMENGDVINNETGEVIECVSVSMTPAEFEVTA